jgi:hypothetical protein
VKVAAALPPLLTVIVQVKPIPWTAVPLTLLVFTAVKSGAVTVTVSEQVLLASFDSETRPLGSTWQIPPPAGLIKVVVELGVTLKLTSKLPLVPIVTEPPLAVQVNVLELIEQLMFPELVMLVKLPGVAAPYVGPLCKSSLKIVWPLVKVAAALPPLLTVIVQVKPMPCTAVPLTLLVFTAVKSGAVTVTVSEQVLLASFDSETRPLGSTWQIPPPVGLTSVVVELGVTLKLTVKLPLVPIVTEPPLAVQVSVLELMEQLTFPELVMLVKLPAIADPYVGPEGKLSVKIV